MSLVNQINDITDSIKLYKDAFIKELKNKNITIDYDSGFQEISEKIQDISSSVTEFSTCAYNEDYINGVWKNVSTLPDSIYKMKAEVIDNKIECLNANYRLEYDGSSWTKFTDIPYSCGIDMCVINYNNELHVLGGGTGSNRTKHYKYDGDLWTTVSTIPYQFYRGICIVYNNEIHLIGGYSSNNYHYKYDGNSWTKVAVLPFASVYGTAVVYNNEIHVISANSTNASKGNHYKYDGTSWSLVTTFEPVKTNNDRSCYSIAVVYNNKIHVFNAYDSYYNTYDGTSWTSIGNYPYGTYSAIVIYNNKIHSLGGSNTNLTHVKLEFSNNTIPSNISSTIVDNISSDDDIFDSIYYKGKIYSFANEYRYEYDGTSWTKISDIPNLYANIMRCAVAIYDNKIHILGGGYAEDRAGHYSYDGTSWTSVSSLPIRSVYANAISYNGELHLIGGDGYTTIHYKWDGTSWTQLTNLPFDSKSGTCVIYNNEIHIVTSVDRGYDVHHYKYDGTTWTLIHTFTSDEINRPEYTKMILYDNKLHLFSEFNNRYYIFDGTSWTYVSNYTYDGYASSGIVIYNDKINTIGGYSKMYRYIIDYNELSINCTMIIPSTSTIYHETTSPTITKINDDYNLISFIKGEYLTIANNNKLIYVCKNDTTNKCYLPKGTKINGTEITTYGVVDYPTTACIIE